MATVDDELGQIERDIRTLKIEYEQYFGGGRARPPADTQWRVDTLVRRYNERLAELSVGQRFRFNNLAQTYAKYQDMWRKKTAQKESGVKQRHYGAAAKTIEAERVHDAPPSPEPAAAGAARFTHYAQTFSSANAEKIKIHELYGKLIEAREQTGESSGAPSLQDFERFVEQKTKELIDRGGREVEYAVTIEGGRVKLKARLSHS
jgi:hypothetical protein